MAHADKFHGYLAAGRRERRQAQQVEIFGFTTKGTLRKTATTHADADKVAETIARLETLNPGKTFTTRAAFEGK